MLLLKLSVAVAADLLANTKSARSASIYITTVADLWGYHKQLPKQYKSKYSNRAISKIL